MSSKIKEGAAAAPIVGSSAASPADQPIPPTGEEATGEEEITVPVDDAAAANPEGETISVVSTSFVCQESVAS